MKVLIISNMFPKPGFPTNGIFVYEQLMELKKHTNVILVSAVPYTFFLKYFSKKWKKYNLIPKERILNGIKIYHPRYLALPKGFMRPLSGFFLYFGIKKTIKKLFSKEINLIHCHCALPEGFAGFLFCKKYNKKLITTIHGFDINHTKNESFLSKKSLTYALNHSDLILNVSCRIKKEVDELIDNTKNSIVFYNGFNSFELDTGSKKIDTFYKNNILLVSVSNLIPTKGVDLTIKALPKVIEKYPKIKLLIIGKGEEETNLKILTKKLNLDNHVFFLGSLPHQEVMKYMAICDIFVLPSWKEGFGIVYIEAMANGKPIIGCEGQGIADIIINHENGILVPPKNHEAVSNELLFLLKNPDMHDKISKAAKNLAISKFTWEIYSKKLVEYYKTFLS